MELSLLCGIDVFLSIVDRNNKVMIYSSADNIKKFVTKHFSNPEKAREVFLNRDYDDIFIKRTHLCQFKHMKKKKLQDELDQRSNSSVVGCSDEISDFSGEEEEEEKKIVKDSKNKNKKSSRSTTKNDNLNPAVNDSNQKKSTNTAKENVNLPASKRKIKRKNSVINKQAKDKENSLSDNGKDFEEEENNIGSDKKPKAKLNEDYRILPSNDFLVSETLLNNKNSAESVSRKFIVEKKFSKITEISESNINNIIPMLGKANNVYQFSEKNNLSINKAFENNTNKNTFINTNKTEFESNNIKSEAEKINNQDNTIKPQQQTKKTENEGISKLKNKLSLKVKIPEEKSEKNNIDNSNSNNNNNYVLDFESQANQTFNLNNEELTMINLHPENDSFKSNDVSNTNIKDTKHNKLQGSITFNSLKNEESNETKQKLNCNQQNFSANGGFNNSSNSASSNQENKILYNSNNKNNNFIILSNNNNTNINPNFQNANNNNELGIITFPQNNASNEYLLGQNYFPFNNEFNQNPQNNYLLYNDPILSARKRLREEYSNFSPLYSANLKAYTPLLSVNSPGMPGFFIFNNGGPSMTTTPLPFKIQNNVMLTSFFQPQTANQNLTLNLNGNVDSKNNKTPNHGNFPAFSGFNNNNNNNNANNGSVRNSEKDENSTLRDNTIQDSSNSLDRASKNNLNCGSNNPNKLNGNQNILNSSNNILNPNINQQMSQNNKNNLGNNIQNIASSHGLQLNLGNANNKNNIYVKKNSQNLIFVPSPLPVNNNFYGWIFNNNGAVGNQVNQSIDLNLNENPTVNDKAGSKVISKNKNLLDKNNVNNEDDVNNPIKNDKNTTENKANRSAKKALNVNKNNK